MIWNSFFYILVISGNQQNRLKKFDDMDAAYQIVVAWSNEASEVNDAETCKKPLESEKSNAYFHQNNTCVDMIILHTFQTFDKI